MNTLKEPTMIGHRYAVIAEPTTALCGDYPDDTYEVDGWDISLVQYEIWSDNDKVIAHKQPMTFTENEKQIPYLKDIVKSTAYFSIAFALGIKHYEAYKLFIEE